MKIIKKIKDFNTERILKKYNISDYTIYSDDSIDVNHTVNISNRNLYEMPIKFNNVRGNFYCAQNNLKTLERGPSNCEGSYWCDDNNLENLKGAPRTIYEDFRCRDNDLTSLEGSPRLVYGEFNCSSNRNLATFKGAPKNVNKFICNNTPIYDIWKLFKDYSKIELLNSYDIFTDHLVIDENKLNEFLREIGVKPVDENWWYYSRYEDSDRKY